MISQQDILNILKNYKDEFIRNFKINSIGLFGSYARNEQEEESDIDLIVEFQEGRLITIISSISLIIWKESLIVKSM